MQKIDPNGALLETLRSLETELHREEVRRNRTRLEALLHPDFVEFGRSGKRYSRKEILDELALATGPAAAHRHIHAQNFAIAELAYGVALLTYVSAHLDSAGNLHRHALRSSIWVSTDSGWQVRFHQGTPTANPYLSV